MSMCTLDQSNDVILMFHMLFAVNRILDFDTFQAYEVKLSK